MGVLREADVTKEVIGEKRDRYITHTDNLMMVVIDFNDGPTNEPDPAHDHPHEQVTYVAAGKLLFFLDGESTEVGPGDMITIPADIPHSVQLLTEHVRLIDTFTPLRQDFLG